MAKKYCSWDVADIKRAIGAFRRGDMGLNQAAERYEVPKATLSRHEKNQNKIVNEDVKFYGGMSCLGGHLEKELVDHCLTLEERFFGLTMNELRQLAFELAEANGIAHNFFKDEKMAGKKWYYLFMKRHPELSPRQPESTSMARAQAFNKPRVEAFLQMLGDLYDKYKVTPVRLYNMDETSLSVQDGQRKILGRRGKKQIRALTSQESGESSTCVVCCSAAGNFIPTMVIYKRKRMKPELTNGGPPGAVYSCQEKGWMSNEGFISWIEHFINSVKTTKENSVILVLDWACNTYQKFGSNYDGSRSWSCNGFSPPPHTAHTGCSR